MSPTDILDACSRMEKQGLQEITIAYTDYDPMKLPLLYGAKAEITMIRDEDNRRVALATFSIPELRAGIARHRRLEAA